MTIQEGYVLTELAGQPYLLPYGQNIASFRRGIRLNESGALIWNALLEGKTEDELLALLAAHYQAQEADYPLLRQDIAQFLNQLRLYGILDRPAPCVTFSSETSHQFLIGTVTLQLNLPEASIPEEFFPFSNDISIDISNDISIDRSVTGNMNENDKDMLSEPDSAKNAPADLVISVRFSAPTRRPVGKLLVRNGELMILEHENGYCLLFSASETILECQIDKLARNACFFCRDKNHAAFREELFHGIRFVYLLQAQRHGLFAVHSASLLYQGQAWLFSGSSGTGKSTHTHLWKELYDDVTLLNGDLNLVGIKDGTPVVYGLPWCGTSGISTRETTPLGGIIFLQQSPENRVETLSPDKQQLMLAQRMISPTWSRQMLLSCLDFSGRLAPQITCFLLHCTKEPDAARICKNAIDHRAQSLSINSTHCPIT